MESDNREHPGRAALQRILGDSRTHHDGYLAIQYLAERLEKVEAVLAARNRAFEPPDPQEVTAYAHSIGFVLDGAYFCDYYQARSWCIGKMKMRDWKAAVRTWKARRAQDAAAAPQKPSRLPDNFTDSE